MPVPVRNEVASMLFAVLCLVSVAAIVPHLPAPRDEPWSVPIRSRVSVPRPGGPFAPREYTPWATVGYLSGTVPLATAAPLTWTVVSVPAPGTGVLFERIPSSGAYYPLSDTVLPRPLTGTLHYTPPPGWTGSAVFRVTATDGVSVSNEATVTIKVSAPPIVLRDITVPVPMDANKAVIDLSPTTQPVSP